MSRPFRAEPRRELRFINRAQEMPYDDCVSEDKGVNSERIGDVARVWTENLPPALRKVPRATSKEVRKCESIW